MKRIMWLTAAAATADSPAKPETTQLDAAGSNICTLDGKRLPSGKPGLKKPSFITVEEVRLDWASLAGQTGQGSLSKAQAEHH